MKAAAEAGPSTDQVDLDLVLKFINTWNIEERTDSLSSPKGLASWFSHAGLAQGKLRATEADLHLFLRIREGLRALAMLNNEISPEARPLLELREVVENQPVQFTVNENGQLRLVSLGSGWSRLAASILLEVYRSMISGSWTRLKTCRSETCLKAFYDHSRNHSGKWCSMSVCGNRMKVRNYFSKNIPRMNT